MPRRRPRLSRVSEFVAAVGGMALENLNDKKTCHSEIQLTPRPFNSIMIQSNSNKWLCVMEFLTMLLLLLNRFLGFRKAKVFQLSNNLLFERSRCIFMVRAGACVGGEPVSAAVALMAAQTNVARGACRAALVVL